MASETGTAATTHVVFPVASQTFYTSSTAALFTYQWIAPEQMPTYYYGLAPDVDAAPVVPPEAPVVGVSEAGKRAMRLEE